MKILFITTHLNTGGITSYLLSLVKGLVQRGHKVFVASAGGNCVGILETYGGVHINLGFRTKSEIDLRLYMKLASLKKLILQEGIDIIHAQTRVTQVMGYFLSRMTHKPLITTCHGFFRPRWFRQVFPCWGKATIAISQPVSEHLIKDFHLDPAHVYKISNGIDCSEFVPVDDTVRQKKRLQWNIKGDPVVGIIARLSDVKGIDLLLKSIPLVLKKFPHALFMIVGEGPEQSKLESLVEALNLRKHVRFEKILNQPAELLPAFDLFVMPSRQEGLGLSVMEAQACALPVIATKVGGLIDLIEHKKTGYLVPVEDVKALADQMIEVFNDPASAKAVGLAARESITKKFSLEQMINSTVKVYEQNSRC